MFPFSKCVPGLALGTALLAAGCAIAPPDRGLADVSSLSVDRGGPAIPAPLPDDAAANALVERLLSRPLAAQDAIMIALVRNPALRAEYARLGVAGADVLEAGRPANPTLSVSVLFPDRSRDSSQVGFGIATGFLDLLLLPSRSRLAAGEFARAKVLAGAAVLDLARDVDAAYVALVGAKQIAAMRETVSQAAGASADLAQRFADAGNLSDLRLAAEQADGAQAALAALAARGDVAQARATLGVAMGLPAATTAWDVADTLPMPGPEEPDVAALLKLADARRLDLQAARAEVALLQDGVATTRALRFLGDARIGVETERETDRSRITGPTLALQLPLFHQNQGGILRAATALELAQADLQRDEIAAGQEVVLAREKVKAARDAIALHRDRLVPLRERIVQRTQEQVNYMLAGVFDLLRAKEDEYDAYQGTIEAIRDYWQARTALERAIGAALPAADEGKQ